MERRSRSWRTPCARTCAGSTLAPRWRQRRPPLPADRTDPAFWEGVLRREGLAPGEFDHDVAKRRAGDPTKADYFSAATDFLQEHAFTDWERACWELHAAGVSNRKIVVRLRKQGAYRKKVNVTIARLKRLMKGRIAGKRGRGRPRRPEGRGDDCLRMTIRFDEVETGAILHIEDAFREKGKPVPPRRDVVRMAVLAFARVA